MGSSPTGITNHVFEKVDPVAQLVEHLTLNQAVVSSNLTRIAIR